MKVLNLKTCLCLLGLLLIQSGCSTTRVSSYEQAERTSLIVSRAGSDVMLSWKTKPGWRYQVIYAQSVSTPLSNWKRLSAGAGILGTGRQITIKDQVPPHEVRRYRLQSFPPKSR